MAKKSNPRSKKTKVRVPKGPGEPQPPRQPPAPKPTPPWDHTPGPDPLKGLKLGKNSDETR